MMKPIKVHVHSTGWNGKRGRRTYVLSDDGAGGLQLLEDGRPGVEAEARIPVTDDVELEVEPT